MEVRAATLVIVAASAVLGIGIGLGFLLSGGDDGSVRQKAAKPPTRKASPAPPPTPEQQAAFTEALNTDETTVLASAARDAPVQEGVPGAASTNATISVDWTTFSQFQPEAAVVGATSSGRPPNRLTLLLLREGGEWRLLAAEPQS